MVTAYETVDASIEDAGFSGVVSIRQGERILYERASGYADRSNRLPNTVETRFGIASGTKFFTALAVGRLIADGKVSLETRLADFKLDIPPYSPDITIQHLLTHTSGIPDYYDEEKVEDFESYTVGVPWHTLKGPRDYLAVFPDEPMKFAPGERFCYSNSGYILLGVLIEELSGISYQEFVKQAVFEKADMRRSGFFALNRLPENTAHGYIEDGGGWRTNTYDLPIVGASDGGAFTTAGDVAALWRAFWAGGIIPPDLAELFARSFGAAGREGKSYGHGLWVETRADGADEVSFSGCDAGVSFESRFDKGTGLEVTVLSNTTFGAETVIEALESHGEIESTG